MFWRFFSYDYKRPMYYQKSKISKEKKEAQEKLAKLNEKLEPYLKVE